MASDETKLTLYSDLKFFCRPTSYFVWWYTEERFISSIQLYVIDHVPPSPTLLHQWPHPASNDISGSRVAVRTACKSHRCSLHYSVIWFSGRENRNSWLIWEKQKHPRVPKFKFNSPRHWKTTNIEKNYGSTALIYLRRFILMREYIVIFKELSLY